MKMPRRTATYKNKKALPILAILLALSGTIRPFSDNGLAFAQELPAQTDVDNVDTDSILGIPFSESAIEELLEAFQARENEIIHKEEELRLYQVSLEEMEIKISQKVENLVEIEEKLASTLAIADSAAQEDLNRLTMVYETMKPRDTAELFSKMAPSFAAGFLGMMQAESAAAIMNELDPNVAHTISVMLAGRNANAFNVK